MRMISRAALILRALGEHPSGLSLGRIAKETGLARATVQRLVGALAAERLVCTTLAQASALARNWRDSAPWFIATSGASSARCCSTCMRGSRRPST